MNKLTKIALILIPTMTLSMTSAAHDPKLHVKKAEKADCSKMDHTKMDMKDAVAIAIMKKCMKQAEKTKIDPSKMDHSKMKKKDNKEADNNHNH